MPATKSTRYGRGRGYGGEANGEGNRGPGPGRPTRDVAPIIAMQKAERIEALKTHLVTLAMTAEREADQITATLGYLKHEDAPAQRVDVTSGGQRVGYVIAAPVEAENADAWARDHAPK